MKDVDFPTDFLTQLSACLNPGVTWAILSDYSSGWTLLSSESEMSALGIKLTGHPIVIAVRDAARPLGEVAITSLVENGGVIAFDNAQWLGRLELRLRLSGSGSLVFFNLHGHGMARLSNVWLRSSGQTFFWGRNATAVMLSVVEIEGEGKRVIIGDDALISSGVDIRNFDMHSIVDLSTRKRTNKPVDTIIEQHVWLGQSAMLICCEGVGYGSIIAAKALAKGYVPAKVISGGMPAKVIAEKRSWGRSPVGMSPDEFTNIARLDAENDISNGPSRND